MNKQEFLFSVEKEIDLDIINKQKSLELTIMNKQNSLDNIEKELNEEPKYCMVKSYIVGNNDSSILKCSSCGSFLFYDLNGRVICAECFKTQFDISKQLSKYERVLTLRDGYKYHMFDKKYIKINKEGGENKMEFILACKMPLKESDYDKLENANINYYIDDGGEGLIFASEDDREKASKILHLE